MSHPWDRFLPGFLRKTFENRNDLQGVAKNAAWLLADSALRLVVGLFVGVWLARYLGPEEYGLYSYALAFVALFVPLATLGLDSIIVRGIVHDSAQRDEILGTAFLLKSVGCVLGLSTAVVGVFLLRPHDGVTHLLVAVIAAGMVFQALDVIDLWFQSQLQSRYSIYSKHGAFLGIAAVKIYLILDAASLAAFAWAGLAEAAIGATGLVAAYGLNNQNMRAWRVSVRRGKALLRDSWPLMLSGIAIAIYMKVDQIMLGELIGGHAVGVFSAATRISEVAYFIPVAIASSALPHILEAKGVSENLYCDRIEGLIRLLARVSIAIAIPMVLLADYLIAMLYGPAYAESAIILSLHAWSMIFVFVGVAQTPWTVGENLTRLLLFRTALGAISNIALNFVLIPPFGASGAAIATVISYSLSAFLLNAMDRRTRPIFFMQASAITLNLWNRK